MGGTAIAAAKSCDIKVSVSTISTSSPNDGVWEYSIAGRKSWSATCSHLVTQIADNAGMIGQTVTLTFEPVDNSGAPLANISALSGTAIVKQWKGTFTTGNLAQGSFEFQGVGPLAPPTSS